MTSIFAGGALVVGAIFCLLGALGMIRLPDVYCRMQSATKATTLGVGLVMLAVAIAFRDIGVTARAATIVLFVFVTAPVGSHMLVRVALILNIPAWPGTRESALQGTHLDRPGAQDEGVG